MNYCLDISSYFNHKLFESELWDKKEELEKKKYYGIPHTMDIHVINKDLPDRYYDDTIIHEAIKDSLYDNIMCDGQRIEIVPRNIRGITILGFCESGTVRDEIVLHGNGDDIIVPIIMKPFHSDSLKGLNDVGDNKNCQLAFYLDGDDGQKHSVYYWKTAFEANEKISSIELPVNLSIHILEISINVL